MVPKRLAVALTVKVASKGQTGISFKKKFRRLPIKAEDVKEHHVKSRRHQVTALSEERVKTGAIVFKPGPLAADTEAHGAFNGGDLQFLHERNEIRIGPIIENDEASIDGVFTTR